MRVCFFCFYSSVVYWWLGIMQHMHGIIKDRKEGGDFHFLPFIEKHLSFPLV